MHTLLIAGRILTLWARPLNEGLPGLSNVGFGRRHKGEQLASILWFTPWNHLSLSSIYSQQSGLGQGTLQAGAGERGPDNGNACQRRLISHAMLLHICDELLQLTLDSQASLQGHLLSS